jgi:hypothetical protein
MGPTVVHNHNDADDDEGHYVSHVVTEPLPPHQFAPGHPAFHRRNLRLSQTIFSASEPPSFPHSICLEVTRPRLDGILQNIFLHPQSQFYIDIEDYTCSVPLRSFAGGTRIPTLAAFFDSLIEVHSDLPSGRKIRTLDRLLRYWLLYLVPGVQPLLPNGELKPRMLSTLKPENRPYFEAMVKEIDIYSKKTLFFLKA